MCEVRGKFSIFVDADAAFLDNELAPLNGSVASYVPDLLDRVRQCLGGALALISSRDVATLDEFFTPYLFPAAGLYGCELRLMGVIINATPFSLDAVNALHDECLAFAGNVQGVFVERGRSSVAVHYLAATSAMRVWDFLYRMLARFGDCFSLRRGNGSYEIIPSGYAKASAVLKFMQSAPFSGRLPFLIGGDATSETAFEAVNHLGGATIRLGQSGYTCAKHSIPTPLAVHRLLAGLIDDFDWLVQQLQSPTSVARPSLKATHL